MHLFFMESRIVVIAKRIPIRKNCHCLFALLCTMHTIYFEKNLPCRFCFEKNLLTSFCHSLTCFLHLELFITDVTQLGGEGSAKMWHNSIGLFSKMGDKGEGVVKNLKKWVKLFIDGPITGYTFMNDLWKVIYVH